MQTPICDVCLKSDMLCSGCKDKLENNKISQAEIDISRYIYELSQKVKSLGDVKIEKIIESSVILIITGKGDGGKVVGKGGAVVKSLAKKFSKSVRVVEQVGNFKEFVQSLISPAVIKGVNTVYTPQGETYKIRIPAEHKSALNVKNEDIEQIVSSLFNKKVELLFEN